MAYIIWVYLLLAVSSSLAEISRKELRPKEVNQEPYIKLERPNQYNRINPSRVIQLSWRPRVFLFRRFLSDEECDHLISLALTEKEQSFKNDGDSGNISMMKQLPSFGTFLSADDEIATRIEERISTWIFLPKENSEPLQVMHYELEEAKQNYTYIGNKSMLGFSVPLMATVVLYLSNVTRGGDILFPESEFKSESKIWSDCTKTSYSLRPIKGNAILFFTLQPNTSPDMSSSHARCPVLEGEMWCATKVFHVRAINEENISPESDGSECTDEDDNCSNWAAAGECQKNPVYMVGSPDYYGTCRKSCNAC